MLEREYRVIVDSDEEIERSFSCLIEEKKTGDSCKIKTLLDNINCVNLNMPITSSSHANRVACNSYEK